MGSDVLRRGLECVPEGSRVLEAFVGALGERSHDHGVQSGDPCIGSRERLVDVLVGQGDGVVAGEGWPSEKQLEEEAAGRVEIAASVRGLAARLLGREVSGRSEEHLDVADGRSGVVAGTRDAEVDELDGAP